MHRKKAGAVYLARTTGPEARDLTGRASQRFSIRNARMAGAIGILHQGEPALDLRTYIGILRRNWLILTSLTLTGILVSALASVMAKPTYTAETQLFVAIQNAGTIAELQQGNTFGQARVQSYVKTAGTPKVLQPVIDELGLTMTSEQLAHRVKATTEASTVLITISAIDESPTQSATIATAVADSLIKAIGDLEKPAGGGASPVLLSIVTPAEPPSTPTTPNVKINLLLGLLIGLGAGFGSLILRTTLDNRIRGEADLRAVTDVPLLAGISFSSETAKQPLQTLYNSQGPAAESFRQLRTNLQFASISGKVGSVVVTSSISGEGKSTTAANLAIALAQSGKSVCLIDADLRRPRVADLLGLESNVGLTTVLIGEAEIEDALQPWGEHGLYVLASGSIPPNPSELLGSEEFASLISHLQETFDNVIIDAPPLLPVTDAAVLSRNGYGVLMLVGCRTVKKHDLERSLRSLDLVEANLLGVILNGLPSKGPDAYNYSYYSPYGSDSTVQAKTPSSGILPIAGDYQSSGVRGEPIFDAPESRSRRARTGR